MRQAGRYLPEYRELRKKYRLRDLFFTPELAALVTKMPVDRFGVDAAILFSDITVVALALGLALDFSEGPCIYPPVEPASLGTFSFAPENLSPIISAIDLLKKDLSVPLLGFCGAPFTVASYLIGDMEKTKLWMRSDPKSFQTLIDVLTSVTISYLQMQEKAGVDAVQIFDSWANVLTREEHRQYSLEPLKKLVDAVKIPSLFFMRESGPYLEEIPCAVSLDWTVCPQAARRRTSQPLQGNLDPDFLFQPLDKIEKQTEDLLVLMRNDPAFIVNLGHGVKPNTPVDAVRCFVETAKRCSNFGNIHPTSCSRG